MISKPAEFTRRILSFPAIRPCDSVSFSTLLASLINLTQSICSFKSKPLFTNKKNARNSIRLIEILAVFLEELQNGNPRFHESPVVKLCLSELHFIFQKIRFLLEDCTRDDSRLWMLMKSEKISAHFREMMRAVTVALDVFPFADSDEVEEMVDMVRKQALKAKFEVEKDDRRAMRRVFKILEQFEAGIAPELSYLIRVLEYLGIKTWKECDNEVKLLEGETGQECSFLSSLMALLIYCRCTLFLKIENVRKNNGVLPLHDDQMIICLNPDDLRCPITLEIMDDPVTIATGHTYDRSSILKWFNSGNHTCPKTGERLVCVDLVQNHALKRIIKQYCHENGIPLADSGRNPRLSTSAAGGVVSPAADHAMNLLANYLVGRLLVGADEERDKASYEIRLLTKTSVFNRSCLVEADAIPPLLDLVSSRNNPGEQENAMAALLNLLKYSRSKRIVVENGGLDRIVDVLNYGIRMDARQHAAGVLFYLASIEEYCRMIGRTPGAVSGLMELLREGTDRGKKNALVTILGLLMCHENHGRLLAAGLVHLLVNHLMCSERQDLIIDSLAVLAALAEKPVGTMAMIASGALPIILEIFNSTNSTTARDYCLSSLLALCIHNRANVVPLLVKNPSLMVSLYSSLADNRGSSRLSKKAGSLIRILHAFNEKTGSIMASGIAEEQFVHVW